MSPSPFVHLHCRSYFSLKDGAFSPEDLARRAAELRMPAVAMTDRDGLYGAARFVAACQREGVHPILGARLTLHDLVGGGGPPSAEALRLACSVDLRGRNDRPSGPSGLPFAAALRSPSRRLGSAEGPPHRATPTALAAHHVVLLARDERGYANLCRLISQAHMANERGEPSLRPTDVMARAEGLVCLLGPESPPGELASRGLPGAARELARPWREAFGPWCFVEVRNLMERGSAAEIRRLLRLAEEADLPVVATNAVRYLVPEDAFLADALECMREIVPVAPNHVSRRNAEGYLKPAAAMRALFEDRPDVCDATLRIAEACTFDIGLGRVHFPTFPTPAGRSATSVLAERSHRGFRQRGMRPTRVALDRLDHELDMIRRMGYAAYFLTVADIVAEVKAMGIRCACRGSAAGSLVCYLTGISEVDPVHHDLLFERFINPLRDDLPDIDLDVESARREEVYEHVLARYGEDRCACVTMVDTFRARAAVREVGKALGYPEGEVDLVAKSFPHIGAGRIREAMASLPELRAANLGAGQLELLFRVAERLNGFPRHLALHPSGIVLSDHDLPDRVPMERSFLEHRMVQADKDDVELLGLLKLDVLGVRMLSTMRHSLDEIERTTGERVDLERIPRDDPDAWTLIRSSRTIGCFQIESPGQRELLQKYQPGRFEDLLVDISLFRPGPVKSDMVTPFLNRRHGFEQPRYAHPSIRAALEETEGVIVYHEQLMRVIAAVGGYDLSEADRIRRHLDDDPEAVEGYRDELHDRAIARGWDEEAFERVWKECFAFAAFGFAKAHAAAFAVPTYQSAWLKAHHPAPFLAGVLTHEPGMYPRRLILQDARQHGVPILPLDVNRSQKAYTAEPVDDLVRGGEAPQRKRFASPPLSGTTRESVFGIRLGFQDVHGISDAEIGSILKARAGAPYRSVGDFLRRAEVSRPVVEALAHAGAFDAIRGVRTRRDRLFEAMTTDPQRAGEQLALDLAGESGPPGLREYTSAERVRSELEVIGMDASRHLLSFYEPLLADLGVTRSRDLHRRRGNDDVMVAGVKVASQTPAVRSGQRIIFLTLDDATGPVDVTVFERVQERVARTVFHGFLLAVWGRLRRTGRRGVSIIADQVWDLTALDRARRQGRLREVMTAASEGGSDAPRKLWHASGGSAGW